MTSFQETESRECGYFGAQKCDAKSIGHSQQRLLTQKDIGFAGLACIDMLRDIIFLVCPADDLLCHLFSPILIGFIHLSMQCFYYYYFSFHISMFNFCLKLCMIFYLLIPLLFFLSSSSHTLSVLKDSFSWLSSFLCLV